MSLEKATRWAHLKYAQKLDAGVDADATVAVVVPVGEIPVVRWIDYSYNVPPDAGGLLTVTLGVTVVYQRQITSAAETKDGQVHFGDQPLVGADGEDIDVTLAAGGAACSGDVCICYE